MAARLAKRSSSTAVRAWPRWSPARCPDCPLIPPEEAGPRRTKQQHDVEILASLPGVGSIVLATLLAEAWDPLQRRDYAALRSLTGVAPVTKRSGKSYIARHT